MKYAEQIEKSRELGLHVTNILHTGTYDFQRGGREFMDMLDDMSEEDIQRVFGDTVYELVRNMNQDTREAVVCTMEGQQYMGKDYFVVFGEVPLLHEFDFEFDHEQKVWNFSSCMVSYGCLTRVFGVGETYEEALDDIIDQADTVAIRMENEARKEQGIE